METTATPHADVVASHKIVFRLRNIQIIELDLSECEILSEIKSLLSENPFLKLHPNIKFLSGGTKINEFTPLSEQIDISRKSTVVDITFDNFNVRTAEKHVMQCAEFFLKPAKFLSDSFVEFNTLIGKTEFIQHMIDNQSHELKSIAFEDIMNNDLKILDSISFLPRADSSHKFFKQLSCSRFNPVPAHLKLQDEFFYLDLVTKDGRYHCLSVTRKGIFANESSETSFSEKPRTKCFLSLVELLKSISSEFEEDLSGYVSFDDQHVYDSQMNCPAITANSAQDLESTFKGVSAISVWKLSLENLISSFSEMKFGQNTKIYRDWNEEFQNCRSLPANETLQQLQKTKILRKICDDFSKAARDISRAVIENQLVPLNPTEKKLEECYVYNNLFITFAQDRVDWEMPKSETSPSTYSGVNADILNLQQIYNGDLNNVNAIHTATIDYFGYRVVVQAIVSGILHFDQKTWNCYGTIDDGKTINNQQDFAPIFEDLCNHFCLTLNNLYKDENGTEITIHGSPEVKGIKAGDNRKYVMDLMRLSPRDANFSDKNANECCVLRPELIKNYIFMNNIEEVVSNQEKRKKQEEEKAKAEAELNKTENEAIEENSSGEKKEDEKKPVEEKNADGENENVHPEDFKIKKNIKFNPSLMTAIESLNPETNTTDAESIKEIAKFITENAISYFITELNSAPNSIPVDMESFIELMHKYGINVRYLGAIYKLLDPKINTHILRLIERVVFIRALRKYVRDLATKVQYSDLLTVVVQNLNIILGDYDLRSFIDQKIESFASRNGKPHVSNNDYIDKPKKGKNKKKKTSVKASGNSGESNECLLVSSSDLFSALREIVSSRYQFPVDKLKTFDDLNSIKEQKDKLAFLREFCRAMGMSMVPRSYNFVSSKTNIEYPIKLKDIIQIKPKIKSPSFYLEGLKYNYKTAENEIGEKNFDNAIIILKGCQNLIVNTYGIYNNDFIFVTSKLANVAAMKGRVEEAIKTQLFVVKVCEKVYGIDHFNTGFAIVELSNYYYEAKRIEESIILHSAALMVFDLVGGYINPSSMLCLHELQVLTAQIKNIKSSSNILKELVRRNETVFGETDERLSFLLGKLAALKSEVGEFKEASLLQARQSFILKKILKSSQFDQNPRLKQIFEEKINESEKAKEYYVKKSKESESVPTEQKTENEAPKVSKASKKKKNK